MYSGLEVRVPFCDHRIVEYAYNMPWHLKAWEGREKGIVRKAFERDLPEEIVWRKKSPYPKTFSPEYTALTASYVRQILQDDHSLIPQLFRREAVETLLADPDAMPEEPAHQNQNRLQSARDNVNHQSGHLSYKRG